MRMKAVAPPRSLPRARTPCDPTLLSGPDVVPRDLKTTDAREIDWLIIGVGACAERVEILGARPPLEDVDPRGIHRISRDLEVETPGRLAGDAHRTGAGNDVGVSVRWIEDEVTGDDEHEPIVQTRSTTMHDGVVAEAPASRLARGQGKAIVRAPH
jgi:hypothetical protein